jgi:hypothetical protein
VSRIVISYRREETAAYAGRLRDDLVDVFGDDQVFMDIDTIEPGVDFVEAIEAAVGSSQALILVIGKQWAHLVDKTGKRRLDDPKDFVRIEVEAALKRNIRVIPVLVAGASMPAESELPHTLAGLSRRQALELSDGRFHADAKRLIESLRKVISPAGQIHADVSTSTVGRQSERLSPRTAGPRITLKRHAWLVFLLLGISFNATAMYIGSGPDADFFGYSSLVWFLLAAIALLVKLWRQWRPASRAS